MSEFKNRISAQRAIVKTVNRSFKLNEELFGLSLKSISRWCSVNSISKESQIFKLLYEASEKLFFLANKSQDQITEDYKKIANELGEILDKITMMKNV